MNAPRTLSILRLWHSRMRALDEQFDTLSKLLQCTLESPFGAALSDLQHAYTLTVSEMIGGNATTDLLEAWWTEHHFGDRAMRAGLAGEPMREITTIDELAEFISGIVAD